MPPKPAAISITLYAPSLDITTNISIDLPKPDSTILGQIRTALGNIDQAYPYDLKHHPITAFTAIHHKQIVLVGTCYCETPLDAKLRDTLIVQPGAAEEAWMGLTANQRREYVQSLTSKEKKTESKTYITLPLFHARTYITSLNTPPSPTSSLAIIAANWTESLDAILGFTGMVRPEREPEDWDPELLAALALLSEALIGQGMAASGLIIDAVKRRAAKAGGAVIVVKEDIVNVGKGLYARVMD
ncbi:hypothetical protein EK21DRAFT_83741 [Setomelanomma holmii]|uniref:Uncharacterized protein n=1 Tax=Setomelanomma holmii TaxID=210430 RepID=A0A9P4LSU8_9PLEO|nr:hypothetical protein EK21DRAFT_83741 [Setomelanomma holmii]